MTVTLQDLRLADPRLSRFEPMRRIICFDDFDRGYCGWTQLVGNYEHTLDSMTPSYAAHTHPQLATVSHWDAGTHGGVDGTYALKIATRPKRGIRSTAIKRLTFRQAGPIRLEFYFTFKPEATGCASPRPMSARSGSSTISRPATSRTACG